MGSLFLIFWAISTLGGVVLLHQVGKNVNFILDLISAALGSIMTLFVFAIPIGLIYGLICAFTTVVFSFAALFTLSMFIVMILVLWSIIN